MTPTELEERLEVLDGLLAAAFRSGDPAATPGRVLHGIETLGYLQSIHLMHYLAGSGTDD